MVLIQLQLHIQKNNKGGLYKMETKIFEYDNLTTDELASVLIELNREYNILKLKRKNGKWLIEVRKWEEN